MSKARQSHEEVYRKARSKYSAAYMSNAKWLKLFTACARSGVRIDRAEWRFIDSDHTQTIGLPREDELLPTRFADGRFQPYEYKWIRSIHVPREYRPIPTVGLTRAQDIARLRAAIDSVGKFQLDEGESGLTIVGYS